MSKKRTKYTSAEGELALAKRGYPGVFKTKLVLELLQNESTLVEIASKHNILPQNLQNWKKVFLANAEIAMEPSKAVKKYKDELIKAHTQNERLTFGLQTSPTSRLQGGAWCIWLLLLIGILKRYYHTKYPTQWTANWS